MKNNQIIIIIIRPKRFPAFKNNRIHFICVRFKTIITP